MKKPGRREFLGGLCASALVGSVAKAGEAARLEKMFMSANETTAIVLGSAQDAGLPHVACQKAHCVASRADVSLRRRASCVAVLEPKSKSAFMFDATPDFPSQLNDIPLEYQKRRKPLAGIFLTHAHLGHYTGLMYLGRAAMNAERVPVYCSRQMAEFLQQNGPWSLLLKLNNIEINIVEPGKSYKIAKSINVKVISVPHRAEFTDTLAFIIEGPEKKLLYLPDIDRWEGMKPGIIEIVKQVDLALIDGTFYSSEELPGRDMSKIPHPTVVSSMQMFQQLNPVIKKRIFFTHLNHSNSLLDSDGKKLGELKEKQFNITEEMMHFRL